MENEDTPENYLSSAVQIKLWRERETREKRSSVMDCVGWKESWNRNCVLLSIHAEFREIGLLTSFFNNKPCTKHPAPALASFPNRNNPQGIQYWLTAVVALREEKKERCFFSEEKERRSWMYLPNPCYPSVTGCHVPWLWEALSEAAESERTLSLTYSNRFLMYSRERRNNIQEVLNLQLSYSICSSSCLCHWFLYPQWNSHFTHLFLIENSLVVMFRQSEKSHLCLSNRKHC